MSDKAGVDLSEYSSPLPKGIPLSKKVEEEEEETNINPMKNLDDKDEDDSAISYSDDSEDTDSEEDDTKDEVKTTTVAPVITNADSSDWKPTKPIMGGLLKVGKDEHIPWTGGKPMKGWTGLEL